jgi:phage terminase large subunit-like protein
MSYTLEELLEERAVRRMFGGVYKKFFNTESTRTDYPKHWQFFDAGVNHRQRLFRAANRVGKTTGAGAELTYHLTGMYPDDWKGKRFDGANSWWVCGKSSETVRQILQPLLLGEVGNFGSGLIPKDLLDMESLTDAKKASTGISTFRVKHTSGAWSQVEFKSYEAGRQAFEGTARSIWCDEEPPEDVYSECLLRTMTGDNLFMMTFTPLKGASKVVLNFSRNGSFEEGSIGDGKHVTTATWDDVIHLDEQAKKELLASIPPYQRDARSKGVPSLGAGAIYPVQEELIFIDPITIPAHWKRCYGLDVGWNRTAAVWGAMDPDSSTLYIYSEHYLGEAVPSTHAASIRARGEWIPGVIDPASRGRTQDDGNQLLQNYMDLGLDLQKANNNVESAIWEILEAFQQGRIKVFNTLPNFLKEFRGYSRDEKGKIVKSNDHLLDAFRYLWNSGRERAKNEMEAKGQKLEAFNGLPTKGWRF